ncbi:MAG: hypothetical protein OIF40_01565 [Mangrovicoccus sp.]|nr:hypothetical protein [Mangrovicoccus sp.]
MVGFLAAIAGCAFLTAILTPTEAALPASVGGSILGLFASTLASRQRAAWAGILVLCAVCANHLYDRFFDPRILALFFAMAAGIEAARFGGRAFTIAIFAAVLLGLSLQLDFAPLPIALAFFGSLAGGIAMAAYLGLNGQRAPGPGGLRLGLRHAAFLGAGLAIAITLARALSAPQSFWVIQMFVFRALAPPHTPSRAHLIFAAGAIGGAALAGILVFGAGYVDSNALTSALKYGVAMICYAFGLRALGQGNFVLPLLVSTGTVLMIAPTPAGALVRAETAALAAILALVLGWLCDRAFRVPRAKDVP